MCEQMSQTSNALQITISLVQKLISQQFPQWAHLPITPVAVQGWDNRTFRLGSDMSIRMPSAVCYAAKVHIEQKWLPFLAPHLSVEIPQPIALGHPSSHYPFAWSIYRWIEGNSANTLDLDKETFCVVAKELANFLRELHAIDITEGPLPGPHNFYRGGDLSVYDQETQDACTKLQGLIDTEAARRVWQKALSSKWHTKPVWIHGDVSAGNILLKDKKLVGVIDFGGMAVGDPACDVVIAWTFFSGESRKIFKATGGLDADTWNRARGWALWKALITLAPFQDKDNADALKQRALINELLEGLF